MDIIKNLYNMLFWWMTVTNEIFIIERTRKVHLASLLKKSLIYFSPHFWMLNLCIFNEMNWDADCLIILRVWNVFQSHEFFKPVLKNFKISNRLNIFEKVQNF